MLNLINQLDTWKGNKTIMVVFPHPDDETMATGGLLMAAKQHGWKTIVVILTQGGAGKNKLQKGELKSIRVQELNKTIKILKVDNLILGDFDDGKLRIQKVKWPKWLNEQLLKHNPGWVVTYDHSGLTGHPDHISLSLEIKNVSPKLWWVSVDNNLKEKLIRTDIQKFVSQPTHELSLGIWQSFKKFLAVCAHRSQNLPFMWELYRKEYYHEVNSAGNYKYKFVNFEI
jgi:hypothetical protein